jgi:hypothetical protein
MLLNQKMLLMTFGTTYVPHINFLKIQPFQSVLLTLRIEAQVLLREVTSDVPIPTMATLSLHSCICQTHTPVLSKESDFNARQC